MFLKHDNNISIEIVFRAQETVSSEQEKNSLLKIFSNQ